MTRTIWFASFGLALLGSLFVAKLISEKIPVERRAEHDRAGVTEIRLVSGKTK